MTASEFFLWCAGTSEKLLEQCKESDKKHQEQLGAHVFVTAFLGCCSSFFALSYAFDAQWGVIVLFSCLWGISIFLFDRTLIISPVLTPKFPALDGKNSKNSKNSNNGKLGIAWPMLVIRVIMAILLALFISTPLELKIFQPEIEAAIVKSDAQTKSGEITQAILDLDGQRLAEMAKQEKSLEPLEKDTPEEIALKAQLAELGEKYKAKTREREGEVDGASGSRITGYGSHALQISRELEALDKETKEVSEKLRSATERHGKDIEATRAAQQSVQDKLKRRMGVLTERQGYLESIASEDAKKEELARLSREQANSAVNGTSGTAGAETAIKIEALAGIKLKDVKKASLLERLKELGKLRGQDDVALTCIVIWCVFVLFETMPIVAKFFFKDSAYDLSVLKEKETAYIDHQKQFTKAFEDMKREKDAQETKTAEQIQFNQESLDKNVAETIVNAYATTVQNAADQFLATKRGEEDSFKSIEECFTKYLERHINGLEDTFSRHEPPSPPAPPVGKKDKPFNADTFLYKLKALIVMVTVPVGVFLYFWRENIPPTVSVAICVGIPTLFIAFGSLLINARKLEIDSTPKEK